MKTNFTFRILHYCGILFFALGLTSAIQAQWSDNPDENTVVCDEVKGQSRNCIVSDGLGNIIIGWRDLRDASNTILGGEIYAQKFNADGYIQWIANGIQINATTFSDGHINPEMVKSENGRIIAVWLKMGSSLTDPTHLYAQKTDREGNRLWGGNVRIFNLPYAEAVQSITKDHSNGVIIACNYPSSSAWTATKDVIAQRINSSGDVMWGATGITICNANGNQMYPSVTCNDSGDSYIVWKDSRNDTGGDIYAQRVDSSGNVKWTDNGITVCSNSDGQEYPVIINDDEGGVIIAWISKVDTDFKVYAQRLDEDGNKLWGVNGVLIAENTYFLKPAVVTDKSGGAIIVWPDTRGADNDIYAQRLSADGSIQWTANGVAVSVAKGNQNDPVAISDGAGGVIITWTDYRNDSNFSDIYAQRLNSSGSPLWQTDGAAICIASGLQEAPSIITDGNEGAVIAWDDMRNGQDYDIYAQKIDKDGKPGGTVTVIKPQRENSLVITGIYPNPVLSCANLSFLLPQNGKTEISVFDITGSLIATPINEMMNAGIHTVTWNTENMPSGVYLIKLSSGSRSVMKKIVVE